MYCKSRLSRRILLLFFSSFLFLSFQRNQIDSFDKSIHVDKDINRLLTIYATADSLSVKAIDSLISRDIIVPIESKMSHAFSQFYYWVHFKVKRHKAPLVLEINNPHLNEVNFFQKNENEIHRIGFGGDKGRTFKERSYLNRRFVFPFTTNLSDFTEYYILIDGRNSSVSFPISIWEQDVFEAQEARTNIYYGLFFGILFFISFLSLITFSVVKKRVFLYYGFYALFMGLYLFTYLGFSFQYLYPNSTELNNHTRFPAIAIFVVSLILFFNSFLEIRSHLPKLSKYYKFVVGFFLLNLVLWFLFNDTYNQFANSLLNLLYGFIATILITSIYAAIKLTQIDTLKARIFLCAFSILFLCIGLFMSIQYGWIEESLFPINPIIIGSGIEILILSIAMMIILKNMMISRKSLELEQLELVEQKKVLESKLKSTNVTTIQLKSRAVISSDKIIYIKSDGHYVELFVEGKQKPEVDRNTMQGVLELLPSNLFIRIHKSYIVNIERIKIINSNQLMLDNGEWIPLSRTYKQGLKDILNKK